MSSSRREFRLTKIICTIGPATAASETMSRLARAGMNVARLNMSHGDHESHGQIMRQIKNLNKKLNHPVAILMDLQGPEIRTGELPESLNMNVGDIFTFTVTPATDAEEHTVHVNYRDMARDLSPGDRITVDNGLINLEVLSIEEGRLQCRVLEGGQLGSRKHINLPGVRVNLPSITEKDKKDIRFAVENDLDFVALSFARRAEDVLEAKKIIEDLDGHAQVIAKIENEEGIENFREILNVADGVMIARGDLGVEIDIQELPIVQRRMVHDCVLAGKPVIVATHLLESMIENPMPTRAEATDVANAIYEQADCVMLSGETATGKYPVKCVQMLDRIAKRMEKEPGIGFAEHRIPLDTREELARSAVKLADSIHAPAILVITRRGIFARQVASFRPKNSIIYAFTNMSSTRRKLWMVRAVVPFLMDFSSDPEKTIRSALDKLRQRNRVQPGDPVVIVSDVAAGQERVTSIQVRAFG